MHACGYKSHELEWRMNAETAKTISKFPITNHSKKTYALNALFGIIVVIDPLAPTNNIYLMQRRKKP